MTTYNTRKRTSKAKAESIRRKQIRAFKARQVVK